MIYHGDLQLLCIISDQDYPCVKLVLKWAALKLLPFFCINQMELVFLKLQPHWIHIPDPEDYEAWTKLESLFKERVKSRSHPDVVLAVDGTLFEIERPDDFEGFYTRKGFPGYNMQALVDGKLRLRL